MYVCVCVCVCMYCASAEQSWLATCCDVCKRHAVGGGDVVDVDDDDDDDVVDDDGRGRESCGYPSKVPCWMLACHVYVW